MSSRNTILFGAALLAATTAVVADHVASTRAAVQASETDMHGSDNPCGAGAPCGAGGSSVAPMPVDAPTPTGEAAPCGAGT